MQILTSVHKGRLVRPAWLVVLGLAVAVGSNAQGQKDGDEKPRLAGTWTWTWKDRLGETHRHVLEVEGIDGKYAARELFDAEPAVRVANLVVDGPNLKFTVVRETRKAEYDGKVADADNINGTVKVSSGGGESEEFVWKAERRKDIPK